MLLISTCTIKSHRLTRGTLTDGELTATDLNLVTAQRIREAAPWGHDFRNCVCGIFHIEEQRLQQISI